MIKGIIFDYGGTLDTKGVHWSHILFDGYRKAGILIDRATFDEAYVYGERELARVLHILPTHNFHDLLVQKVQIELGYLARLSQFPPQKIEEDAKKVADYCYDHARQCIEEVRPVLERLSKKYPLVMVSNFYGNLNTVLKDFDIQKYFKKVVESAVVGVRKPDPEIFRLGVKALGLPPDEVLVIGDSLKKDILPALEVGCQGAWLKGRGWQDKEETAPSSVITISSLSDLKL